MSAIGLSTFFPRGEEVPGHLVLRLTEVNVASLAACFFCYDLVLQEFRKYWRRGWSDDDTFWRFVAVAMAVGCAIDLGLLAAAVGVGLRDLQKNTYARDTIDSLYIAMKITLWVTGMFSELFFVLRVRLLTEWKVLVWVLYCATSAPFVCAFIFFLLYRFYEFQYGYYARIFDLVGAWCNALFAAFTVVVLGWRIVVQRRMEAKTSNDALLAIFYGGVATSALIGLSSVGAAICCCFLNSPETYMFASFFWNIYPQMAAVSCLFALHQRHTLRRRLTPTRSFMVGERGGGKVKPAAVQIGRRTGDNPAEWRADKVSLGPGLLDLQVPEDNRPNGKRRGSKRGMEVSFHDVELNTNALDRCQPLQSRAGTVDIWVHREEVVTVDEPEEDERAREVALEVERRERLQSKRGAGAIV
ncbi:hypothetical protein JCM8547_009147 [Rhodosporidiobolus lusitaniae]